MEYQELSQRVEDAFEGLSAQLKRAARYVLDHPDDVALLSMRQFAAKANVHPSTMMRLIKELGMDGYAAFQEPHRHRLRTLPKPIVAAVNGYALGAGAEMAISADFVLMKHSAQIGFPEVSIGTFLGGGVTHVLPQLVGMARARELVYTGERINGEQAASMGLATRSFSDETYDEGVKAFAKLIASKAPVSMAFAKDHFAELRTYDEAFNSELDAILACMKTDDWAEGVAAFAEKRPPVFKGQ
ncbi:enoyl-CoA hydratase-related protein [Magnetovibrio sp. PR-2]|uniref:enoyl-CoA hydratase-related protein n=1 Tax=Magnetovibrio sp. PR-2 TaxID=3120356 RepID=UPI002FCE357B